jgi:RecB family endonuclease NucS
MAYLEIKTRNYIDAALTQQIIDKKTVIGILTTGKISTSAKKLFEQAGIAWAEHISEKQFMDVDRVEER